MEMKNPRSPFSAAQLCLGKSIIAEEHHYRRAPWRHRPTSTDHCCWRSIWVVTMEADQPC